MLRRRRTCPSPSLVRRCATGRGAKGCRPQAPAQGWRKGAGRWRKRLQPADQLLEFLGRQPLHVPHDILVHFGLLTSRFVRSVIQGAGDRRGLCPDLRNVYSGQRASKKGCSEEQPIASATLIAEPSGWPLRLNKTCTVKAGESRIELGLSAIISGWGFPVDIESPSNSGPRARAWGTALVRCVREVENAIQTKEGVRGTPSELAGKRVTRGPRRLRRWPSYTRRRSPSARGAGP